MHRRSEHRRSEHRHSEHRQHGGFLCFWHSEASAGTGGQQSVEVRRKVRNKGHFSYYRPKTTNQHKNWRHTCDDIILLSVEDYWKYHYFESCKILLYFQGKRLKMPKKAHYIKIICKLAVSFFCLWVIRRCWNVTLAELDIQMWDQSAAQTYRCEIDIHFSMNRNVF